MGNGVPINHADGRCDPKVMLPTALAGSARRLLLALDGARADAYEWDFSRARVSCTGTLSRELGIPPEEDTAAYLERVHPDDRDRLSLTLTRLAPDKAQFTLEYRLRLGSGAYVHLVDSGKASFDVTGRCDCVLGIRRRLDEDRSSPAAAPDGGERYRMLLHAVPSMTFEGDADGGNIFASEQWCAYTGLTPEQTAGFGWAQAVHPEDLPEAAAGWAQAMRNGNPCELRHRIRGADGSYRWFLLQAKPLRDACGRINRWVGSLTNIEELQRTEEALRDSERRVTADLGAIVRLQKLGMQVIGDGNLEPLLGEIVDAAISVSDADFGSIEILDPESRELRTVAQRGFPAWWIDQWDTVARRAGASSTAFERGERVIVEDIEQSPISIDTPTLEIQRQVGVRAVQSTPLITRSGKVVGMLSTHYRAQRQPDECALRLLDLLARQAADIIERAQAEAALRESEERLRFALETSHTGAWELDLVDHTAHRSLEHDRLFGYAEMLPRWTYEMFLDHVLSEDRAAVDAKFREATATGGDLSFECRIRRVDGEVRWIWAAGRQREDRTGRPRWMAGVVQDITERKLTEEALRQSREDLDHAQEVGQIGWWRLDILRNVLTWSDENHRIFGVPKETPMSYETFLAIVHPDDRQYVDSQWKEGLLGNPYDVEHRIVVGERVKWVREKAYLEFDDRGALLGGFGITQDITERKQAEQALRDSERRYRELVENANSAIIRWRKDGTLTFFNEYAEQFFGYRADEVLGRHVGLLVPDQDSEGADLTQLTEDIARDPARFANNINENVCRDGRRVWMSWTNRPILDERGAAIEILAIGSDITERIRAEQALRESEERFQLASEIGRSGTWDWNVASGEVVWSRGHFEILGYRLNEVRPCYAAWADRVHPEDRPGVEAEISRSMGEHSDYAYDFRVVWPDESIHWMTARARYEYDDNGVCRRMVGIMADVTELKEAEHQLLDMNARLTTLLDERTRMADEQALHLRELAAELTQAEQRERDRLYELLHDHVQPPLVGARLSLSGLDQRTPTDTCLRIAAEAAKHITEALDTARSLGAELNPPVVREQGLGPALEWLCHWARSRHRLEVDLAWDLTAEPADTATRMLLFKATRELLMNVAKHAGVHEVTVAMERSAGPAVQITVSDRGAGFDIATGADAWGLQNGSGLWNIERRLRMIGGRIAIDSTPGAGTTVRLWAPLHFVASTRTSNLSHGQEARQGAC